MCEALHAIQLLAMGRANVTTPHGKAYQKEVSALLKAEGFDRIEKGTRSLLCKVARNMEAIEIFRTSLSDHERVELNHPRTVWDRFRCSINDENDQSATTSSPPEEPRDAVAEWKTFTEAEKKACLANEGADLVKIIPRDQIIALADRALALKVAKINGATSIAVAITKELHVALLDPAAADNALARVRHKLNVNNRSATDIIVAFAMSEKKKE